MATGHGFDRYWRHLPTELRMDIHDRVTGLPSRAVTYKVPDRPCVPPRNSKSPLMELPPELRREIFGYLMPEKHRLVPPTRIPKIGSQVRNLLVLNKQICSELLVVLYEERTFTVNVYEGIYNGGIEFLNSGRQRLQYKEHFHDVRFKRFEGENNPFDFSRVRRLNIDLYPAVGEKLMTSRHDSMHTHFMLRALVKLLQRWDGTYGINSLKVRFNEPRRSGQPNPWACPGTNLPRSTSIHGVSNVEVILHPLLELRRVHGADIELPSQMLKDAGLTNFSNHLFQTITTMSDTPMVDNDLGFKIEAARDMLDDWLLSVKYGNYKKSNSQVANLDEKDFAGDFMDAADEDGFYSLPSCTDDDGDDDEHASKHQPAQHAGNAFLSSYEKRSTSSREFPVSDYPERPAKRWKASDHRLPQPNTKTLDRRGLVFIDLTAEEDDTTVSAGISSPLSSRQPIRASTPNESVRDRRSYTGLGSYSARLRSRGTVYPRRAGAMLRPFATEPATAEEGWSHWTDFAAATSNSPSSFRLPDLGHFRSSFSSVSSTTDARSQDSDEVMQDSADEVAGRNTYSLTQNTLKPDDDSTPSQAQDWLDIAESLRLFDRTLHGDEWHY